MNDSIVRWEYKVIIRSGWIDEIALNVLGDQGWELISVCTYGNDTYFYFKRLKADTL